MTNKKMNLRPATPMTCVWHLTGNNRAPLACVWTPVESATLTSIAPPAAETSEGRMRLCA